MEFKEFKELLKSTGNFDNDYSVENFIEYGDKDIRGDVEFIASKPGEEGGGEDCWSVIRIDDIYYKILYSYYSYNGSSFDYAEVIVGVKPKQKTITVYE